MNRREEIIFEALKNQYPYIADGALERMSEWIDEHWHILKKKSLEGVNGDWTLAGHIQSTIWDTFGGGGQASVVAHKVLRKLSEEGLK